MIITWQIPLPNILQEAAQNISLIIKVIFFTNKNKI
jgi:hypothetical protein